MEKEGIYTCLFCGKKLVSFNCDCRQKRENTKLWSNSVRRKDRQKLSKITTKDMLLLKDSEKNLKRTNT